VLKNGSRLKVYASPYQPESKASGPGWQLVREQWAFQYPRTKDRFNSTEQVAEGITSIATNPIPNFGVDGVDVVVTHGPPKGILDMENGGLEGCDMLLRAVGRAKPLMHCFGHIHEGHGAHTVSWADGGEPIKKAGDMVNLYPEAIKPQIKYGDETLMVNAAFRDRKGQPKHVPWLVELDLPRA
jgi:hypothetical protein